MPLVFDPQAINFVFSSYLRVSVVQFLTLVQLQRVAGGET